MNVDFPDLAENGSDKQLSARQQKGLAALITSPSVPEAAKTAGISERSLYRWLAEDNLFIAEYRAARRRVVEEAEGMVQSAMTEAASVLRDLLDSDNESIRFRAACAILKTGFNAAEDDLVERVEALEAAARYGGDAPW